MTLRTHRIMGIIFILLICTVPAWAGNSIFSFQGLPYQYYGNDIYGLSMGDTGMSDTYRLNTGFGNPALLARTKNAVFSTGLIMGYTVYRDQADTKYRDNSLDFPYFNFVVPIASHKIGFQFQSLSSGVVKNQRVDSLAIVPFTEFNSVDSYLYRVDLMYARPFKYFNFGVSFNYYLGHETRTILQDSGNSPFNTFYSLNKTYDNGGFTVGITKDFKEISTALTFTSGAKLTGETIFKSLQMTEHLDASQYNLPNRIGLGFMWKNSELIRTTYDFHYDMWKAADNTENTEDSWKVGVGFAYDAHASADQFLQRIPLRAGISMRRLPFLKNDAKIDEMGASCGFSLPLKNPDNRIDIGFQYLMRGDKDKNQVEESSFMLLFGITGFDIFTHEQRRTAPRDIPKVEDLQ
jgi:hypothetical protein